MTSQEFSLTQISCELANPDQVLTLSNGQKVTIVGTVDGQMIGVITFQKCSVK